MKREAAEAATILKCLVGSQAYGLSTDSSDRDEKGVLVEDFETFCPLYGEFEQFEHRTATERTGAKDAKSEPGDLDLTIYGLSKFLRLCCDGNPNSVELLFIKGDARIVCSPAGEDLQHLFSAIISRQCGKRYLGYMEAQKQRLLGERGQMRVTRTDLIEAHGYDTKYAGHVVRLGFQGVELLETGKLELPVTGLTHEMLMAIKAGKWGLNEVLQVAGDLEQQLKDLVKDGPLQDQADTSRVERWMQGVYWETWQAKRHVPLAESRYVM